MHRKQLVVFFIMLVIYALCAFVTYAFFVDQLAASVGAPMPDMKVSPRGVERNKYPNDGLL